jgi:uncharacterized membrane protein YGL010W
MNKKTVKKLSFKQVLWIALTTLLSVTFGLFYFEWPSVSGIVYMIVVPALSVGVCIRFLFGQQDKDWIYSGIKDNK